MTDSPAAEQLLNLADRAEKGLTPDEAQRLRDGLAHHCARAERAEAEVERMKLLVAASTEDGQAVRMAAQYADRAIENGKRAERAEAAIERVGSLVRHYEQWGAAGWQPFSVTPSQVAREYRAALAPQEPQPGPAAHTGGNAEDCPACTGTNPPYPFLCPGPTA